MAQAGLASAAAENAWPALATICWLHKTYLRGWCQVNVRASCKHVCMVVLQQISGSSSNDGMSPQQLQMVHLDGFAQMRRELVLHHLLYVPHHEQRRRWQSEEEHARCGFIG